MKTATRARPGFMAPACLTAAEYQAWVDAQTDEAIVAADAGEATFSSEQVREEILKRRLARVRAKTAA